MEIQEKKEDLFDDEEKTATREKKTFSCLAVVLLLLATVFVSSIFGAVSGFLAGNSDYISKEIKYLIKNGHFLSQKTSENNKNTDIEKIVVEDSAVTGVVEKSAPAVVSIVITKEVTNMRQYGFPFFGFPDLFDDEFGTQQDGVTGQKEKVGGGTGFFISEDGMIVTNKHVVSDSNAEYTVITNDEKEYPAKVLARDPSQDIAIIKIEGNGFPVLPLGNSESLKIGQTAIAIGNSLGEFSNTVSKGIISGLKRNLTAGSQGSGMVEQLSDIIQTDAAINPGNSGGPLIDIEGNAIGVNVAIAQNAQSVGFALPIDQVKRVIKQVRETGKISTPFLGVRYIPINKEIQQANNLPYEYGVLVQRGTRMTDLAVVPGSPADKAGIVENDIILEIDGKKIDAKNQLADLIAKKNAGDKIVLKIWHKGDIKDIQTILEERI